MMRYKKDHIANFSQEEKLLNHLVLHANDQPSAIGLLHGKMGIAITLAHYARIRRQHKLEFAADFLIEDILCRLSKTTSIDFSSGLSGIGWGIEYLIQQGYLKGCGADILAEIDAKIMEIDILRMSNWSLERGLVGLLHYTLIHWQGANISNKSVFDKTYLTSWKQLLTLSEGKKKILIEGKSPIGMLEDAFAGKTNFYRLPLVYFVQPNKKTRMANLSLSDGVAGLLETRISV